MKITGGDWKGRKVKGPGRGREVRPSGSRVREALFNVWAPWLPGSRCLDLFAGVGTLGFEALSRGAEHVTFVERDSRHARWLSQNLRLFQVQERARILVADVFDAVKFLGREGQKYHLVFADPPYGWPELMDFLAHLKEADLLVSPGQVALEHSAKQEFSVGPWTVVRFKKYGDTGLTILGLKT